MLHIFFLFFDILMKMLVKQHDIKMHMTHVKNYYKQLQEINAVFWTCEYRKKYWIEYLITYKMGLKFFNCKIIKDIWRWQYTEEKVNC